MEDTTVSPTIEAVAPTQWGFRVMAINSVVERNVEDDTISVGGADGDGLWSSP